MYASLRSQLALGAATAVGAGAVFMTTPVVAANLPSLTLPTTADVTLSAFDSPVGQLLDTTVMFTNYLFSNATPFTPPPPASNLADGSMWPFANFGNAFGNPPTNNYLLPVALAEAALGGYSSVGLIPQIIDDALPIISQLGYNGTEYLQALTTSLYGAATSLEQGIWNLPAAVISAIGEVFTDPQQALADLVGAVVGPVIEAGSFLLAGGGYIATGLVTRAAAVLATIPSIVVGAFGTVVGGASVVLNRAVQIVTDLIGAFGTANPIENAWNAVIGGLLGPSGLPGTLINLTLGAGVQTGPIAAPSDIAGNFVPSVRTSVQTLVKTVAGALATPIVSPSAASPAEAAPSASAVRAAAAAAPAAAESAAASAIESAAGSDVAGEAAAAEPSNAAAAGEASDTDAAATSASAARTGGKAGAQRGSRG